METWTLTEIGRRHIREAEMNKTDPEEKIIASLSISGLATVEEIARKTGLDIATVQFNLKRLDEKSWVWKKITKFTQF